MGTSEFLTDNLLSEHDFNRVLNDLVRTAIDNDVDICGGWTINGDGPPEEYGIEIYPVERRTD